MSKLQKKRILKKTQQKKRKIKETKKGKKEIKEVSLEKNIGPTRVSFREETENIIDSNEFREFLQPIKIQAPVLKKVEIPNLEISIASSPMVQKKEKETGINYSARKESKYSDVNATNDNDEKKYENDFNSQMLGQSDPKKFRQEILEAPREIEIDQSIPHRIETNIIHQKARDPFEKEEEKYTRVDF